MLRALTLVLLLTIAAWPGFAADTPRLAPRPLASALHAMQAGRWEVAAQLAARDGHAARDLIEWYRLRAGQGSPADVLNFIKRNPHWPGLGYLRQQSEDALTRARFDDVLTFYKGYHPQTGTGALNYARALTARGKADKADAGLVKAWLTMDLSTEEHDAFIDAHAKLLEPHHAARLDMALWRGLRDVQQMLPLVTEDQRKLAETRQMVEGDRKGLEAHLATLSKKMLADPHVAYALFNRHIRNNKTEAAIDLILTQSHIKEGLGQPERWAGWRRALARSQMREGKAQLAYDLAATHQLTDGANFADLEWLSGYLALTYLDEPELALDHFQRFRVSVNSPISLGRAGYWIGRTQEALNDPEAAQLAYAHGAEHQTSFYGLLAAEHAALPADPRLDGTNSFPPWRDAPFAATDLHEVTVLALATGQLNLAEQFVTHLSEIQDRTGLGQMGEMLLELEQPHLQVMLGKAAARRGIVLPGPYYPLHPMTNETLPVPAELALAIARRESEFDFNVVSGAGAQGLMQLMPGTARDVANDLKLEHQRGRVMSDWRYNALLGSTYLAQLADRFDGNVVMVSAAYNAGPGRPVKWIEQFGDPRGKDEKEVVDWVEHIPFRETRNYVMRVAESLPVYRARLGEKPLPVPFSQELTGSSVARLADKID
ncbi:Soluble lytic murein transglycosylase precursor [Roseovarius litorisediminis]|uniref:Soluble lytic murein transglycosylase n=1 Tax=Roseovarius litorisediminis TaxID=1312363 RepID=A0A1Y5ST17_9RHOB|nr:lytic transglycosylase domain-containing protein [Roseovarius litorisediminis]SLN45846.1 Soluble lytic murein transglycosylase precursor [Roseovarius litorisediminis]